MVQPTARLSDVPHPSSFCLTYFPNIFCYLTNNIPAMQPSEATSDKYNTCLENIESLEAFYQLESHQQLVSVALDRELSRALKIPERVRLSIALRKMFEPKADNPGANEQARIFA